MKKLLLLVSVVAAAYAVYLFFIKETAPEKQKDKAILTVAVEGTYRPWSYKNANGDLIGFDVEMAKDICASITVHCSFVQRDWGDIIPGLLQKKYDVVVAAMAITPSRQKKMAFSAPYADPGISFASSTIKKKHTIKQLQKILEGKIIAVQNGTVAQEYVRTFFKRSTILGFPDQLSVNRAIISGAAAAGVNENTSWLVLLKHEANISIISPILRIDSNPILGKGFGVAMRKSEKNLKDKINHALRQLKNNGTLDKLSLKWLGYDAIIGDKAVK